MNVPFSLTKEFHHKIEMQKVLYPEGLVYSAERGYFETANRRLFLQLEALCPASRRDLNPCYPVKGPQCVVSC
jgi:hypothetical protein